MENICNLGYDEADEKWQDSTCMLKPELTGFADCLVVQAELA